LVSYTVVPPLSLIFSPWPLRPPHSPLFPYTTLFRSGFCFLTYMAITLWFIKPQTAHAPVKLNPFKQIGFALSVSLLNPHAILDTVGIIGTNSTAYTGSDLLVFTLSCIAVSWIAFVILVFFGRILGSIDKNGKIIFYINKVSAAVIFIIACVLFINIIKMISGI